jgi:hypothetical protein
LVELKSKDHVRSISISDDAHDRVLFEGDLGRLLEVSIIECSAFEVVGENGVLRMEIGEDVLRRVLESPDRELSLSSEVGSYTNTNTKRGGENEKKGNRIVNDTAVHGKYFRLYHSDGALASQRP